MSSSTFFLQQIKPNYNFKNEHGILGLHFCEPAFWNLYEAPVDRLQ